MFKDRCRYTWMYSIFIYIILSYVYRCKMNGLFTQVNCKRSPRWREDASTSSTGGVLLRVINSPWLIVSPLRRMKSWNSIRHVSFLLNALSLSMYECRLYFGNQMNSLSITCGINESYSLDYQKAVDYQADWCSSEKELENKWVMNYFVVGKCCG